MSDQARDRAHLRPLPRCHCGKPATHELFNGLNSSHGKFCLPHANAALEKLRAGK